jgi:hypothetical protein
MRQAHAQLALEPRVVQPARLAHEAQQHAAAAVLRLVARHARRARHAVQVGGQVDVVAHRSSVSSLACTMRCGLPRQQRGHAGARQVVGVDVVGVDVVLAPQHRRAARRRSRGVPFSRSGA